MAISFDELCGFVDLLRRRTIGSPTWIESKQVYEYDEKSAVTVAVLKIVRAVQGVKAVEVLIDHGLVIDFGAAVRGVLDAVQEALFLLETYPQESSNVSQFVKAFFETTIDGYLDDGTPAVPTKKVRAANVRFLAGQQDEAAARIFDRLNKTFSGYVHANYSHIMETYGGLSFAYGGIPDQHQRQIRREYVELMTNRVFHGAVFIAQRLNLRDVQLAANPLLWRE